MPRRGQISKRDVLPDPVYGSKLVTKLVNNIMKDGKKGVAQKIVYDAFDIVKEKSGSDTLEAFQKALDNIMPQLEIKARRVGGATYQVPIDVRPDRKQTLGLRWLINYARAKRICVRDSQTRLSTRPTESAAPLRREKTHTRWQKPTRLSLTTGIKKRLLFPALSVGGRKNV